MNIAFTVDLEPDWGVPDGPCRVLEEVLPGFLEWAEASSVRATFFAVAEMARRHPDAIRRIAQRHEVASHGLSHRRLDRMDAASAMREIDESRKVLQDVAGKAIGGFRAPYLARCKDLATCAKEAGYAYDSSGGACAPSPANALLPKGAGPFEYPNGLRWLPISAMRDGLNPFCLTALRVGHPLSRVDLPRRPRMFFLHLHELSGLPVPDAAGGRIRRALLRKGRGDVAWRVLKHAVERYQRGGARWVSCEEFIAGEGESR